MKKGLLANQQTPIVPVLFSQFGLLDRDAPGSQRRHRQWRIAEDKLEALRRGRYAERHPRERSGAVAHVDGTEPAEDGAAVRIKRAARGPAYHVDVLRLTQQ